MKFNTIYDKGEFSQCGKRYVMFVKNEETMDIEGYYLKSTHDVNTGIVYISKTDRKKMNEREFNAMMGGRDRLVWFEDIKPYKLGLTEYRK